MILNQIFYDEIRSGILEIFCCPKTKLWTKFWMLYPIFLCFGFVFSRRGAVPEACSSWFLPRIVGISKALDWCFSGKVFPAQEALNYGLVSEVVEEDNLVNRALEIGNTFISKTSSVSVALSRQMLWRMLGANHPMEAHMIDSLAMEKMGKSSDIKEGILSFLERREPEFPMKVSKDLPDIGLTKK